MIIVQNFRFWFLMFPLDFHLFFIICWDAPVMCSLRRFLVDTSSEDGLLLFWWLLHFWQASELSCPFAHESFSASGGFYVCCLPVWSSVGHRFTGHPYETGRNYWFFLVYVGWLAHWSRRKSHQDLSESTHLPKQFWANICCHDSRCHFCRMWANFRRNVTGLAEKTYWSHYLSVAEVDRLF